MTEREAPVVSIVMNCYNGARYLREAIESVLAQSYENWELVFWDNQSKDDSAAIFKSYQDPRLQYHYAPEHTVLYSARNFAIQKCRGDLIAFLDVDDLWVPEKLQVQIPLFANPSVGISAANFLLVNERRGITRLAHTALPFGKVLNDLFANFFIHFSTVVVRRKAVDGLRYVFDPRFNIIGDFDFILRLCVDWEMATVQRALTSYRWHFENLGLTTSTLHSEELNIWLAENREIPEYRACPGFATMERKIRYYDLIKELYAGRRREAWRRLDNAAPRERLKVLFAMLLPVSVVRRRLDR